MKVSSLYNIEEQTVHGGLLDDDDIRGGFFI